MLQADRGDGCPALNGPNRGVYPVRGHLWAVSCPSVKLLLTDGRGWIFEPQRVWPDPRPAPQTPLTDSSLAGHPHHLQTRVPLRTRPGSSSDSPPAESGHAGRVESGFHPELPGHAGPHTLWTVRHQRGCLTPLTGPPPCPVISSIAGTSGWRGGCKQWLAKCVAL